MVVAEGLDRLSRKLKDIAAIYDALDYHGVVIWTAHEGKISELHIGLKGTMNALVLRDMKARVKRGHRARIAAGFAASSCAYGYRVVRGVVDDKGRNVNGVREVDEAAATIIRRVYSEYIAGRTLPEIIAGLNRDGIPSPSGALWKRNALMGGAAKQEGILRNEIYTGKLIFNRSHVVRDPVSNKKRFVLNPESEWTKVEVPHLRIISDEDWAAARLLDQPRPQEAKPRKRMPAIFAAHNQHALTGWIKCGWCGGSKSLANETRYLCSTHRYAKKCTNSRGTKEAVLMAAAYAAIFDRIEHGRDFSPALHKAFAREAKRRRDLEARETDIKARLGRLVEAVERGVNFESATQRILELQDELERVRQDIQHDAAAPLPDEAAIRASLVHEIHVIERSGNVEQTRLMFECLLREIVLTPIEDQRTGETIKITLREDGWPAFWRRITA